MGSISSVLLLDSYVVDGAVIQQAKHCRVQGESYGGCAEVIKRVVEVPGEGCWCSLQRRPLGDRGGFCYVADTESPGHLICFWMLPYILVILASQVIWLGMRLR